MACEDLGRKILSSLNTAFLTDADINEFDVLPVTKPEQNQSPLILIEHKLGLEAWAIRHLYLHVYKKLVAAKQSLSPVPSDVLCWTRAVVLIQADSALAWNWRKCLVLQNDLDPYDDLKLCSLVLTRHPKSAETFIQRKWLINHIIKGDSGTSMGPAACVASAHHSNHPVNAAHLSHGAISCLQAELSVCTAAAEKYSNNYYAWGHRLWVLEHLGGTADKLFFHAELQASRAWVSCHVSDHSGLHYCQYLLQRLCLLEGQQEWRKLLEEELELTSDLILSYPGHEALWCHRRFVITQQAEFELDTPRQSTNNNKRLRQDISYNIIEKENQFIEKTCSGSKLEWQHTLAKRHEQWLRNVLPRKHVLHPVTNDTS